MQVQGYALQCRVTTEDPENKFTPDYGRITHYRSVGGLGIRTDGGPADHRRNHHAVLRLAAGEDLCIRPPVHRRGPANEAGARRVPRAGGEDQYSVPAQPACEPRFPGGQLHDPVHRREPGAVPFSGSPESSDAALDVCGRDHGQRLSGRRPAAGPGHHARAASTQGSSPGRRRRFPPEIPGDGGRRRSRAGCASNSRCS